MPTIYFDSMEEAIREACYKKVVHCVSYCYKCGLRGNTNGENCNKFVIANPLEALKLLTGDTYKINISVEAMAYELCDLCNKYGDCGKCPLDGVMIGETKETLSCPFAATVDKYNDVSENFIRMAYYYAKRVEDERENDRKNH